MAGGAWARLDSPGAMHDRKTVDAELPLRRPDVPVAAKGSSAPGPVVDRAIVPPPQLGEVVVPSRHDHVVGPVGRGEGSQRGAE